MVAKTFGQSPKTELVHRREHLEARTGLVDRREHLEASKDDAETLRSDLARSARLHGGLWPERNEKERPKRTVTQALSREERAAAARGEVDASTSRKDDTEIQALSREKRAAAARGEVDASASRREAIQRCRRSGARYLLGALSLALLACNGILEFDRFTIDGVAGSAGVTHTNSGGGAGRAGRYSGEAGVGALDGAGARSVGPSSAGRPAPDDPPGAGGFTGAAGSAGVGGVIGNAGASNARGGTNSAGAANGAGGSVAHAGTTTVSNAGAAIAGAGTAGAGGTSAVGGSNAAGVAARAGAAAAGGSNSAAGMAAPAGAGGSNSAAGTAHVAGGLNLGGSGAIGGGGNLGAIEFVPADAGSCAVASSDCNGESCCLSIAMPSGTFGMGRSEDVSSPDYYPLGRIGETPERYTFVGSYALDKYEVTVGRFRAFLQSYDSWRLDNPILGAGNHPKLAKTGWGGSWTASSADLPSSAAELELAVQCDFYNQTWRNGAGRWDRYPINCVTWFEAFAFCLWDGGRLPTEAEWEYAAAGGTLNLLYPWLNEPPSTQCALYESVDDGMHTPVGSRSITTCGHGPFGHLDLAGSASEWIFDWYREDYYEKTANISGELANTTPGDERGTRGGSWIAQVKYIRVAVRAWDAPNARQFYTGFRCARPVPFAMP